MQSKNALKQIIELEDEACMDTLVHRIHPLTKLLITVAFLGFTVSFGKYDLAGVLIMCIYPFVVFTMSMVSFSHCIKRIWPVIPVFFLFGIFNVFFERDAAVTLGTIKVSYGIISAIVLICKGTLAVMSGYLLIATTGIENICYGLSVIKVPKVFLTQILLTYRYLSVLITQAGEVYTAYSLRAPGQKGINIKAWGPLLGQMLLRSVDKAENVYESMLLRGYSGEFTLKCGKKTPILGITYGIMWISLFIILRFVDISGIIGKLILSI